MTLFLRLVLITPLLGMSTAFIVKSGTWAFEALLYSVVSSYTFGLLTDRGCYLSKPLDFVLPDPMFAVDCGWDYFSASGLVSFLVVYCPPPNYLLGSELMSSAVSCRIAFLRPPMFRPKAAVRPSCFCE